MPEKPLYSDKVSDSASPEASRSQKLGKLVSPYSHSPPYTSYSWPVWSLSALFFGTSAVGFTNPALPPFAMRFGFGFIFLGAGYVLSTGDIENGSAITTSWSGSYFVVNALRREMSKLRGDTVLKTIWSRHPLAMTLNGTTLLTMLLYGGEYFWFQNFSKIPR